MSPLHTKCNCSNDLKNKKYTKLLRCLIGFGQPRRDRVGVFCLYSHGKKDKGSS